MEPVEIFLTVVAVVVSGGATIIAWAARHDALLAAKRAEAAEHAALSAWQESATALTTANRLRVDQNAEAVYRERRLRRVEPAERAGRWYRELAASKASGVDRTRAAAEAAGLAFPSASADTMREVELRLEATGEPGVGTLLLSLRFAADGIAEDDHAAAIEAGTVISQLVARWIDDPERFELDSNTEEFKERLRREHKRNSSDLSALARRRRELARELREAQEEGRRLDAELAEQGIVWEPPRPE